MIENTVTISVDVDPAAAYEFLTDTSRWHEWMESLEQTKSTGNFRAGARVEVEYTEGAKATMEIVRADAPSGYSYEVEMSDMAISGTTTLVGSTGGTTITYRETVEPRSFMMKLMKPFIAKGTKRALEKDYQTAKQLMEAR